MNLHYGEIVSIFTENGMRLGKVRVGGAIKKVALDLLPDVGSGARVFLCDGVAIAEVEPETETDHVPRHSR